MGMLASLFNLRRRKPAKASRTEVARINAKYDAAQIVDENKRHWANADGLSANSANSFGVRQTLRQHSRYETANNSYAAGLVRTLADFTIGSGPRLQLRTEDAAANRAIEAAFDAWCKSVRLSDKLHMMHVARSVDGEPFGILTTNDRLGVPVKLDLRVVEADQVATPDLLENDPEAVDGIRFDQFGNPIEYHILKHHPGELSQGFNTFEYETEPAELVIHVFREDRPGQRRGIPWLTPALPLYAQLRRFTLATLAAAETAADIAGTIQTDAPPDDEEGASIEPFDAVELERRTFLTMPEGWKISQVKAEHPTTTYREFKHEILNEISRALNIPFNIAAANSSGYNYASGRLDHQSFFQTVKIDQKYWERTVMDRLFQHWLDEALLVPDYLPSVSGLTPEYMLMIPHEWYWDGLRHVDPLKEASAQERRLNNNTTTLAREYAEQGDDWETQLRQRAKEKNLMRELGLTEDESRPRVTHVSENSDEEEEAEEANAND